MLVTLNREYGAYEIWPSNQRLAAKLKRDTGHESILFQLDWDWPRLAENLGWNIVKAHKRNCPDTGSTDGTVTCAGCGRTAGHFIASAVEWLDKRVGNRIRVRDCAYFE